MNLSMSSSVPSCVTGSASGQGSDGNSRCFKDSGYNGTTNTFTVMATAWGTTGGSGGFTGSLANAALGLWFFGYPRVRRL